MTSKMGDAALRGHTQRKIEPENLPPAQDANTFAAANRDRTSAPVTGVLRA